MSCVDDRRSATEDRLIYAVGDIHGRLDALCALLAVIAADAAQQTRVRKPILVFLGDYVDRGPHSREVLDVIVSLKARQDWEIVALKGNHEQALLRFLEDAARGPQWALCGGAATLASYGVSSPRLRTDIEGWECSRAALEERMPKAHLNLLRSLELIRLIGDFAFVHAGIRPEVSLADQTEDDLLWIRQPFLSLHTPYEKVVVHGHTPAEDPFSSAFRIGVDTAAYATGVLTAVRLEGSTRAFLQTTSERRASLGEAREPSRRAGIDGGMLVPERHRLAALAALAIASSTAGSAWAQSATNAPVPGIAPYAPKAPPASKAKAKAAAASPASPGEAAEAAEPDGAAESRGIYDYRLGPGDKLRITVFGEDGLSGEFFVAGDGRISFPLIGEVSASGKTVNAVQAEIAAALRDGYLKDPRVSAEVLIFRPYYILGEVTKPGEYPYSNGMTVMNAVATAGGFTYRANQKYVYIKGAHEETERKVRLTDGLRLEPGETARIVERYF